MKLKLKKTFLFPENSRRLAKHFLKPLANGFTTIFALI
jgi:hypothetical protein